RSTRTVLSRDDVGAVLPYLVYWCDPPPRTILFSLLPRAPISTLFPYTTLFRSDRTPRAPRNRRRRRFRPCGSRFPADPSAAPARDRKSTRLNSSHGSISYAVFCLKKKKPECHVNRPTNTSDPDDTELTS